MNRLQDETKRIIKTYSLRDSNERQKLYRWSQPDALYISYRKKSIWAKALIKTGYTDLKDIDILDIGCGSGNWLRMFLEWGANKYNLHGIDLLEDRIAKAKTLSPVEMDFRVNNSWPLPYVKNSMNLCAASTVFSSILNPDARHALAREMVRVLKRNGWVMIYDYAVSSPNNPDTTGINKKEILRLFSDLVLLKTYSLTLAPPLVRFLSPKLLWLAHTLEALIPLLCTHRLYVLQKNKIS